MVNLMKQTLTINVTQTAADMKASQIETIVHSHEPDVEVSEIVQESYIPEKKQEANESYNNEDKKLTVRFNLTGYRICGCLSNIDCKRLLHQIYH